MRIWRPLEEGYHDRIQPAQAEEDERTAVPAPPRLAHPSAGGRRNRKISHPVRNGIPPGPVRRTRFVAPGCPSDSDGYAPSKSTSAPDSHRMDGTPRLATVVQISVGHRRTSERPGRSYYRQSGETCGQVLKVLGSALLGAYGFSRVLKDFFERPEQFTSASPNLSPTRDVAHGSRNPPQLPMGSHRRERSRWSISRGKNWGSPRRPVQEALRAQDSNRQRAGFPRCISRPRIASGRFLLGMMLIINMPVMRVAPRPRVARPRLLSRGPGAWTRSTPGDADRLGSAGRRRHPPAHTSCQ